MRLVYPAIFHKDNGAYWAEFPDLEGCQTYGKDLNDTLFQAKEALEVYCITLLEQEQKLTAPSRIEDIETDSSSFVNLVDIEIKNYISKSKAVKKTLTIPAWLNDAAKSENINFSQVLQDALIEHLHIQK
ncbi:type II toxin-antitoxin system HicB family antitoxin [Acetivibrio sp. MSJd-27]|uniref:type II toxin-antitoxin system HicB family antitoxin n=1 Tax=Acetivibrio sp. MSJd-27 TaxID=2841523 RepID=UPI001C120F7F|nr:type II toxin-antitoxin system HicB family antitoxin [Acetivibrio sp. MSJd-27]MBU5451393.1 type II toxin-antitoxin system HicB family antitoxin [Acetivibrio sp. MSJd-27]